MSRDPNETPYTRALTNAFNEILVRERTMAAQVSDAITRASVGMFGLNTSDPRTLVPRRPNRHERRAAAARNR